MAEFTEDDFAAQLDDEVPVAQSTSSDHDSKDASSLRKDLFDLLSSHSVSPFAAYELLPSKVTMDTRFTVFGDNDQQRRDLFDEYCRERARLPKKRTFSQDSKRDRGTSVNTPTSRFIALVQEALKEHDKDGSERSKLTYKGFKKLYKTDDRFLGIILDDERRNLFSEASTRSSNRRDKTRSRSRSRSPTR